MREAVRTGLATLATFVLLVTAWTLAVRAFGVPSYVLPPPSEIWAALRHGWVGGMFWEHAWFTLRGALTGFAVGSACGILAGAVVAEIRVARLAFYPIIIAIQSMPTVAIAPLIVVYLGVGLISKVVTVALLCFFPVFVNTVAGIGSADPRLIDLYRAASAPRLRIFLDVKLPSAADHIMASLQIAIVLSLVGCVVSEFVASRAGLGYVITLFANELNVSVMFAAVISLAVIGASCGFLVMRLHRAIVFWK